MYHVYTFHRNYSKMEKNQTAASAVLNCYVRTWLISDWLIDEHVITSGRLWMCMAELKRLSLWLPSWRVLSERQTVSEGLVDISHWLVGAYVRTQIVSDWLIDVHIITRTVAGWLVDLLCVHDLLSGLSSVRICMSIRTQTVCGWLSDVQVGWLYHVRTQDCL